MADHTAIEWTDATWSPWEGCTKVSTAASGGGGCDNCYAEAMNRWLHKGNNWGPGASRRAYSEAHWQKPIRWDAKAQAAGKRMRVFPSVCDPFDNEVDPAWRARFFALIYCTPHLDWLLLTKRIGNAAKMLEAPGMQKVTPGNVSLGITAVNQTELDRDAPKLLRIQARVHFLSYEPALGPIEAARWLGPQCFGGSVPGPGGVGGVTCPRCGGASGHCPGISWVIAGGESGPRARPAHPDWFRSLRDQCAASGVPFLFKQWGEWLPAEFPSDEECFADDGSERQLEGRIRRVRVDGHVDMARIGKKAAGRQLDGRTHDDYPKAIP